MKIRNSASAPMRMRSTGSCIYSTNQFREHRPAGRAPESWSCSLEVGMGASKSRRGLVAMWLV